MPPASATSARVNSDSATASPPIAHRRAAQRAGARAGPVAPAKEPHHGAKLPLLDEQPEPTLTALFRDGASCGEMLE
jgi:hypothetical protein